MNMRTPVHIALRFALLIVATVVNFRMKSTVDYKRLLLLIFFFPLFASAQSPALVQHVSCPNSRNTVNQQSNTPDYKCPLPEPSQPGNDILVGVVSVNTGTFS